MNETRWDTDTICAWLDTLGLYMYSNEVRKSVTSGAQLAALTSQELESKLGIRNLMHRKKVCLALLARQQGTEDPAGLLDHQVQIVAFSFITIYCAVGDPMAGRCGLAPVQGLLPRGSRGRQGAQLPHC